MPTNRKQEEKYQPIGNKGKIVKDCGILNLEYTYPFVIHIHYRKSKLELILN
jgi:hypothetical protein